MVLSRRIILFLIAFLMAFALVPAGCAEGENLLQNADFSELDSDGMPEYWFTDAYYLDAGYTVFGVSEGDSGHEHVITIQNIAENDARFAQAVEVEPDSLYKLSGYIRASGIEGGLGANLSIEGIYAFSDKVYDTEGEWEYIEYYGETGPDQDYIVVFARLGGYSGICSGKASFSNLSLTKVDSVPGDLVADMWYRESADSYNDDEYEDPLQAIPATAWLILISLVYTAFALLAVYHYEQRKKQQITISRKISPYLLSALFFSALVLRILISSLVEGYMVDVNCFLSWGKTMANSGPTGFYQDTNFCDYPPLYTYVLALNSEISRLLHAGPMLERVIFRFVPCLCDLIGCFIVYRLMVREHETSGYAPYFFLIASLFNPAAILNSAAWGQMDSVLCLLLLAVSVMAVKGKWMTALPLYVIAVLIKPQALMLGPLGLIYILITYVRKPESRKPILYGTVISILTLAAGVIPFSLRQNWDWLINLYKRTLESYPYATVNTANFYYILGGNWNAIANEAHILAPVLLGLLCIGYGLWWYFCSKEKKYLLIETLISFLFASAFIICAFVRASWALTGGIAMGFAFVIVLSPAIRRKDIRLLPWLGGLLYVLLYVFGVKMHERYIFPALLLFAAAWTLFRDRRILYVLVLFSVTTFINEGIVLDNSIRLGSSFGHLNPDTVVLADLISLLNISGALYAVWLSTKLYKDIPVAEEIDAEVPETEKEAAIPESISGCEVETESILTGNEPETLVAAEQPVLLNAEETDTNLTAETIHQGAVQDSRRSFRWFDRSLHWNKRDTILLSVITAVYAAISLLTLGSTKAPQTAWTSSSPAEEIVFDLGEYRDNFEILYFGQVSSRNFSFSVSKDGKEWEDDVWAQMDQGQCWKWKYVILSYTDENENVTFQSSNLDHVVRFSGRYVKLKAHYIGLTLNEVLFRNENGEVLPVRILDQTGAEPESVLYSDPASLIDEQDTLERLPAFPESQETTEAAAQPGWWNSSYFDEIYHARTGFEFLHGKAPYETSHPPLGKILISLSIAAFGMCPFGWRFAGAVAGILMLPGMYLLVKQLSKKTSIAALACLLMALDCQHLTQTQIATIDSFPVLFIIFEYFFMLRFIQTDYLKEKKSAAILPLLFSGLFMGLSIASKWIGIYAGAGLAFLFFTHCYRVIRSASKADADQLRSALRRTLILCLWCILFFILIPVIIYLLSYIPYFAYLSGRITSLTDYIKEVIKAQIGMFNYHSEPGLGMNHPFYSPWWEWPIIGKPMYYASQEYIPAGFTKRNSIFCFGNPVIWYGGLAALAYCLFRFAQTRRYQLEGTDYLWHIRTGSSDFRYSFILIGFLAQYLPWVLVPRGTYIYHYFASLPFIMTAIAVSFDQDDPKYRLYFRLFAAAFAIAAAVFFIILFPYACGLNVCKGWLDIGNHLLRIWYNP